MLTPRQGRDPDHRPQDRHGLAGRFIPHVQAHLPWLQLDLFPQRRAVGSVDSSAGFQPGPTSQERSRVRTIEVNDDRNVR
jgi:hypothetical protein